MNSSVYSLLDRKRAGEAWSAEEVREYIDSFMEGAVEDYQMTAFLMAIAINGASADEARALTNAMLESGEQWRLRDELPFIADKHSTGGVGDKISLVMTPWLASCGVPIAMLSGRGLGHTGGTLDKLEAIPGFNAALSRAEILACLAEVSCAIATSTPEIAPADRRLYALRDVTGTVRSIPLITASIMSKKLAMGASALVLDVKTGRGAFMREIDQARELARSLISAAEGSGTRVRALITDMDQPLGRTIGNANEVAESMAVLRGEGPEDVRELSRELCTTLMEMNGFDRTEARERLEDALSSGRAAGTAARWIEAQGGDPAVVEGKNLPGPRKRIDVLAGRGGFVSRVDSLALAELAIDLGAGRRVAADSVDHAAGISEIAKCGEEVSAGDRIAVIELGDREIDVDLATERVRNAFAMEETPTESRSLVVDRLDRAGSGAENSDTIAR